jgi:hypothetical protein
VKIYFVVRSGWNAANQSAMWGIANPKNKFESNLWCLVAIVQADSEESAITRANPTCYNGQGLFATTNPRQFKGLTSAIRQFNGDCQ